MFAPIALLFATFLGFTSCKTFENVNFQVFNMYTLKYNGTIISSNVLNEHLPELVVFDTVQITNASIPVLSERSIAYINLLDELILENDGIVEIKPGAFYLLPALRKLIIRYNNLVKIDAGTFTDLSLSVLELNDNNIITIARGAFDNLTELLRIRLDGNKLKVWNAGWFQNTPSLRTLYFQRNLVETLSKGTFKNLKSSPNLSILLSYNKIHRVEDQALEGFKSINKLWLDNNQITQWPQKLLEKVEIGELRLEFNNITCFNGDLAAVFKADETSIEGNPLDCACLDRISVWANKNHKNVQLAYASLSCSAARIDRKIKDLNAILESMRQDRRAHEEKTVNPEAEIIETQF